MIRIKYIFLQMSDAEKEQKFSFFSIYTCTCISSPMYLYSDELIISSKDPFVQGGEGGGVQCLNLLGLPCKFQVDPRPPSRYAHDKGLIPK